MTYAYRTQYIFEKLPPIAKDSSPTFTYAHLLVPHPPFIFDSDGAFKAGDYGFIYDDSELIENNIYTLDEYINNYIAQLTYAENVTENYFES